MTDKTGSVLTNTQRQFLRGESDVEETGARARALRARIRQRIRAGLEDFQLLFQKLPRDDRRQVFESIPPKDQREWISSMIAFAFSETDSGEFAELIENSILQALSNKGYPEAEVDLFLDIDREPVWLEDVVQMVERGEKLDRKAIARLVFHKEELTEEQEERLRQSGGQRLSDLLDDELTDESR